MLLRAQRSFHLHHAIVHQSISRAAVLPRILSASTALHSAHLQTNRRRAYTTSLLLRRRELIFSGQTTADHDIPDADHPTSPSTSPTSPSTTSTSKSPYYLETAYAIFAKRPSRPFPPPFLSTPSHSFSDPLTTHQATSRRLRSRRPQDGSGRAIGGITSGDDAVIVVPEINFLAVGDGVGAWAQKERGHAALWSRLVVNYWAGEVGRLFEEKEEGEEVVVGLDDLDLVSCLQRAYERTRESTGATGPPGEAVSAEMSAEKKKKDGEEGGGGGKVGVEGAGVSEGGGGGGAREEIMGTTTASGAVLHHDEGGRPVVIATTLGDSMIFVLRPDRGEKGDAGSEDEGESQGELVYKSKEQWHWFDCPRQLGTNSPDTPNGNAVMDKVPIDVGDVVVVVTDGVTDNLFETEIVQKVCGGVKSWERGAVEAKEGMVWVARELMNAAREIAQDPNAESPYMEKALDEGISAFGGKLDDISVVIGVCRRREK